MRLPGWSEVGVQSLGKKRIGSFRRPHSARFCSHTAGELNSSPATLSFFDHIAQYRRNGEHNPASAAGSHGLHLQQQQRRRRFAPRHFCARHPQRPHAIRMWLKENRKKKKKRVGNMPHPVQHSLQAYIQHQLSSSLSSSTDAGLPSP